MKALTSESPSEYNIIYVSAGGRRVPKNNTLISSNINYDHVNGGDGGRVLRLVIHHE